MSDQKKQPDGSELRRLAILLRNEQIPHEDSLAPSGHGFNLGTTCESHSCGTVACIGGWEWLLANPGDIRGADAYVRSQRFGPKEKLFFGVGLTVAFPRVTPEAAADAIDNFLETGDPRWPEVEAEHGL